MDNSSDLDSMLGASVERLTAKRISGSDSASMDRWYPYYAGYSYAFAREILTVLDDKRSVVLDPWNGSGTTTSAAYHLGNLAVGFDLNPATVIIAKAKLVTRGELTNLSKHLESVFLEVVIPKNVRAKTGDPLSVWIGGRAVVFTRYFLVTLIKKEKCKDVTNLSPPSCALILCLFSVLRKYCVNTKKSNHAWLTPDEGISRIRIDKLKSEMRNSCGELLKDLTLAPLKRPKGTKCMLGDSRALPIKSASIGLILTSPPYCTRIDYAKSTAFELAVLGVSNHDLRQLRDSLMGTTTIRKDMDTKAVLPDSIAKLLSKVKNHPSRASSVYYLKNTKQYFVDAFQAIEEISRVLKPGGRAFLVLQNSYYKEIPIALSELYCDLAHAHGLDSRIIARKKVNRTMAAVNSRAQAYRKDRNYSEDLVLMEKRNVKN